MNRGIKRHKRRAEKKREQSQRSLLADGEKCCKPTDLFVKSSAASASTSANTANTANTASTNVSKTGEPTHLEKDSTERNMSRRMKRQTWITA